MDVIAKRFLEMYMLPCFCFYFVLFFWLRFTIVANLPLRRQVPVACSESAYRERKQRLLVFRDFIILLFSHYGGPCFFVAQHQHC